MESSHQVNALLWLYTGDCVSVMASHHLQCDIWCIYTVSQKSDAKIQITIITAYFIRIIYPLSGFNHHLSDVNVANFNKIQICNVCARNTIIRAYKRIFNSDKICRSVSDLNFGVTFLGHSVYYIVYFSLFSHTHTHVIHSQHYSTAADVCNVRDFRGARNTAVHKKYIDLSVISFQIYNTDKFRCRC